MSKVVSGWIVALAILFCFGPSAFGQSQPSNRSHVNQLSALNVSQGMTLLPAVFEPLFPPLFPFQPPPRNHGGNGGNNGGNNGGKNGGGSTPVPEGGSSLLYLGLAGLTCLGAALVQRQRKFVA